MKAGSDDGAKPVSESSFRVDEAKSESIFDEKQTALLESSASDSDDGYFSDDGQEISYETQYRLTPLQYPRDPTVSIAVDSCFPPKASLSYSNPLAALLHNPKDTSFNFVMANGDTSDYQCLDLPLEPVALPPSILKSGIAKIRMKQVLKDGQGKVSQTLNAIELYSFEGECVLKAGFDQSPLAEWSVHTL